MSIHQPHLTVAPKPFSKDVSVLSAVLRSGETLAEFATFSACGRERVGAETAGCPGGTWRGAMDGALQGRMDGGRRRSGRSKGPFCAHV